MLRKTITIGLSSGLEARPVAMLVQIASQYESAIYVEEQNARVNAKSIMGMMSLRADVGEEVTVVCEGEDEEAATVGVEKFLAGEAS